MSAHTHSSPNHAATPKASAHAPKAPPAAPKVAPPPATVGVAETPTSTASAAAPVGSHRALPLFAIALAIVGTLPIGLGIGMARRAANTAAVASLTKSKHKASPVRDDAAAVERTRRNRHQADEFFRAREFRLALQLYQSNETVESLRHSEEVAFKIALCREALGQWDEALTEFRELSGRDYSPFQSTALLAQSRIWLAKQEPQHARAVLRQLLKSAPEKKSVPSEIGQDARLYFAMTWLLDSTTDHTALETPTPISPLSEIAWKGISPLDPNNIGVQITTTSDSASDPGPEASALKPDSDRLQDFSSVTNAAEAEQFLEQQIAAAPQHRLIGHAKLAWGHFAHQRSDFETAAMRYEMAMSKSSDTVSLIAAYNSGVVHFQRDDLLATVKSLGQVVDGAPGHDLVVPALILRGRAAIALGSVEQAAFDLKRAADVSKTEDERSWATAFMGMAFLQARQQDVAAKLMFQRRDRITTAGARTLGGLVVALARLETMNSAEARDRETLFLLRALANLNPDAPWLGDCGRTLIGRAYREVDLGEQMAEVYSRALANSVREPFASEMKLSLGEYLLSVGDEQQGLALLTDVREAQHSPWPDKAALRMAQWELSQHREQDCLSICHELLRRDSDRAAVLRLMGTAYERSGNLAKAAECYAGVAQ